MSTLQLAELKNDHSWKSVFHSWAISEEMAIIIRHLQRRIDFNFWRIWLYGSVRLNHRQLSTIPLN
jgi:hypothetical protein